MSLLGFIKDQDSNDIKRQQLQQQEQLKALEFLKTFRPMLEDAAQIEDPATRKSALGDLMSGYNRQFGQKIDKDTLAWMVKNPDEFKAVLKQGSDNGLRIDQLFPALANPMLRGVFTIGMDKAARGREAGGLLGGTNPTGPSAEGSPSPAPTVGAAPSTPAPNAGTPTAMATSAVAAPTQAAAPSPATAPNTQPAPVDNTSPVVAPTPALDARAQQLDSQIRDLDRRAARIAQIDRKSPGLGILEQQRARLAQELFKIREEPAVGEAKQANEPVTAQEIQDLRDAYPKFSQRFVAGMPRKARDALVDEAKAAAVPGEARPALTTPEKQTQAANITRRGKELPETLLRDPNVQRLNLNTVGQFEDAKTAGALPIRTVEQIAGADANARDIQSYAFKRLENFNKVSEEARQKRSQLEVIANTYRNVGPTGPLVGPLRQNVLGALQLFGVDSKDLAGIQTMQAANIQLVRATLKDFSGNDSDRDVLTAMAGSPGVLKLEDANKALLALSVSQLQRDETRAANARKWTTQFGSLANKDPGNGLDFDSWWDNYSHSTAPIVDEAMMKKMGLKLKKRGP